MCVCVAQAPQLSIKPYLSLSLNYFERASELERLIKMVRGDADIGGLNITLGVNECMVDVKKLTAGDYAVGNG